MISSRKTPSCLGPDSFLAITNRRSMSFTPMRHLAPVSNRISSLPESARWTTFRAQTKSTISGSSSNPPSPTTSTSIPSAWSFSTNRAIEERLRINTAHFLPAAAAGFSQLATTTASSSMVCSNANFVLPWMASGFATSFTGSTCSTFEEALS